MKWGRAAKGIGPRYEPLLHSRRQKRTSRKETESEPRSHPAPLSPNASKRGNREKGERERAKTVHLGGDGSGRRWRRGRRLCSLASNSPSRIVRSADVALARGGRRSRAGTNRERGQASRGVGAVGGEGEGEGGQGRRRGARGAKAGPLQLVRPALARAEGGKEKRREEGKKYESPRY